MISHTLKNVQYSNSKMEIDGSADIDITVLGGALHASCPRWLEKFGTTDIFLFDVDIPHSIQAIADFFGGASCESSDYFELIRKKYNYSWFSDDAGYYDESFNSKDWKMRALVAMNGMYLNELSNDVHPTVRQKIVSYLITKNQDRHIGMRDIGWICFDDTEENINYMTYTASVDARLKDIDYIDKFTHDNDKNVRYELARLGIQKHLDVLVSDADFNVRTMVAKRGHASHLAKLATDSNNKVRLMVAINQNTSNDTLCAMSGIPLECESVQIALVERGYASENLINSPHVLVRMNLASLGIAHQVFYKDSEDLVRSAVATRTTDNTLLSILANDESELVRDSVAER